MARQRREKWFCISGIVVVALCALLVISLARRPEPVGRLNEGLNHAAQWLFGVLAWVVPVVGVYWGWKLIVGGPYRRVTLFSVWIGLGFLTLSSVSHLGNGRDALAGDNVGGRIGHYFAAGLGKILGSWGTLILMLLAFRASARSSARLTT